MVICANDYISITLTIGVRHIYLLEPSPRVYDVVLTHHIPYCYYYVSLQKAAYHISSIRTLDTQVSTQFVIT